MSITQQYALDLYRASKEGAPLPPAPGTHDWRTVRELRDFPRPPRESAGFLTRLRRAVRGRRAPTHCAG